MEDVNEMFFTNCNRTAWSSMFPFSCHGAMGTDCAKEAECAVSAKNPENAMNAENAKTPRVPRTP
jgi:hypothetical protein